MEKLLTIGFSIVAIFMATVMIVIRSRASKQPANAKKIILPPLFMSTGALMFLFPYFRVPWPQVFEALLVGMFFSIFLIMTTKFEIDGKDIYLKPSKAFIVILILLFIVRLALKSILGQQIEFGELGGMFYLLAFGMLFTWRAVMLYKFLKMKSNIQMTNGQEII